MPLLVFIVLCLATFSLEARDIALIRVADAWRYQRGWQEPTPGDWRRPEFDASGWPQGPSGFSSPLPYTEATALADYELDYTTVYFRKSFEVADPAAIHWLTFRVDYDDGMVVYLNGQEILRRGAPGEPNEPVPVGTLAEPHPHGTTAELDLTAAIPLLVPGTNLLAVQILGATNSPAMAFVPELLANFNRGPFIQNTTSNSTQIVWKTPFPAEAFVDFGLATNESSRVAVGSATTNHVATLTNLLPGTTYSYRIGGRDGQAEFTSDWSQFTTLKTAGPISFTVLGDSGVGTTAQYTIAEEMHRAGGDLVMHLGDMIYSAFYHSVADFRCLSVYADQLRATPMFVALGNHDFYGDKQALLETFYLPTNNVTGTEHYYSFDHGDVHFTVLWTDLQMSVDYTVGSPQYQWLTNDLASTSKPWKFLFFHHVIRSSGVHNDDDYDYNGVYDELQLRESIGQAAIDHGVQIIFNGHDHCYEKCAPVSGPLTFVSGGGGAFPYPIERLQPASVQFHSRHNFLRVTVDSSQTRVEAIGLDGKPFDVTHVPLALPAPQGHEAAWQTPLIELGAADDLDGNITGQNFDFAGLPISGLLGKFSSPGRLYVNNDATNLYLGFEEVMLQAGQELFLFIEIPGLPGLGSLESLGNGTADPLGEGADGLDFLANVSFTNFQPSIGVVLGDEFADGPDRSFWRAGLEISTGQGAYFLEPGLPAVPGQRLQQYDRSPQDFPFVHEQNASVIELSIPFSALGTLAPGQSFKAAAVVGLGNINVETQSREVDTGAIAAALAHSGDQVIVEPVGITLAPDTDYDTDGLSAGQESILGTDPRDPDSDGDTLPDGWEKWFQLDPLAAQNNQGAEGDPDGDTFPNLHEFLAGTDPRDQDSCLKLVVERTGDSLRIVWNTTPGKRYVLEQQEALDADFHSVAPGLFPITADGMAEEYIYRIPADREAPRYFRIRLVP